MSDLFESYETEVDESTNEADAERQAEEQFEAGVNRSLGIVEEPEVEDVKSLFAGMSEDELRDVFEKAKQVDEINHNLKKTREDAFGRIGSIEHQLKQLNQQRAGVAPISKDTFKALTDYFGDDGEVANALAQDLSSVHFGGGAPQPVDISAIMATIEDRTKALSSDFETKFLTFHHPDWEELVIAARDENGVPTAYTDEVLEWQKTLKPEAVERFNNSENGLELANAMTKFKEWRTRKAEANERNKLRLESAILPTKGSTRHNTAASDDAFNQGLKKVISQRNR